MQALQALLISLAFWLVSTAAENCSQQYIVSAKPPLLFGGVADASRCKANCQSRDTYWGRTCTFNSNSGWGTCSPEQATRSLALGLTLGKGAVKDLTPCDVVKYIRGRTLWILGDSHGKSFYRALQCFLIDYWSHQECEASPNAQAVQELYNLPEAPGQSKCFHLLGDGGGRVCMVQVVLGTSLLNNSQVAMGGVLPLLRSKFAHRQDIFYINFGVWHKKTTALYNAFRPALEALGRYYQSTKAQWPYMMFHELPAEHPKVFSTNTCAQMRGYIYNSKTGDITIDPATRINIQGWSSGESLNVAAREVLSKYGMPVVTGFAISVPLYDNHIMLQQSSDLDCLHYCHPGVPEMWIWYMHQAMKEGKSGIRPIDVAGGRSKQVIRAPTYRCVPSTTMF